MEEAKKGISDKKAEAEELEGLTDREKEDLSEQKQKEKEKKEKEAKMKGFIETAKGIGEQIKDFNCGLVFFAYDVKSFAVFEKDFLPKGAKKK